MTPESDQPADTAGKEALARYRAAARRRRLAPSASAGGDRGGDRRRRLLRAVGAPTGPGPDARDPQRAGDIWRDLAERRGWTSEMALWSLANRWDQIVGVQIAEHVAVVAFEPQADAADAARAPQRPAQGELLMATSAAPAEQAFGGKLTLQADSNAWQQQMIWNLPHLQRRLDRELGRGVVGSILVLGPASRSRRYGSRRV